MPVVEIPDVGDVEFPDSMSDAEISSVIESQILPAATARKEKRAALVAEQAALAAEPEPSTASLFMEESSKPFVSLPKPKVEEDDTKATRFAKGVAQAGIGAVEGIASPLGVATVAASAIPGAGPIIARVAGLGFGASAIKAGVEEGAQAFQAGDAEAGGRAAGNLLLGSALARLSVQAPKPKVVAPVAQTAAKAEASGLPKAAEALKEVATATTPAEIPLGDARPALRDRGLEVLNETEFDAAFRDATTRVTEAERAFNDRPAAGPEREGIAQAQDAYTAALLERFRRNTQGKSPPDLFRELRQNADAAIQNPQGEAAARFKILQDELQRQGAGLNELLAETSLRSSDAAEAFGGQLESVREASRAVAERSFFPDPVKAVSSTLAEQPSSTAIGIVPPGTAQAQSVIGRVQEIFRRHEGETLPVELSAERLPDFQAREVSQSMAASPRGAGRIPGFGYFFDARAKAQSPLETTIITRQFEKHAGDAIGNAVELEFGGKIDKAFDVQPDGTVGVVVQGSPARVPISDAFEALQRDPTVFDLTPEQAAAFEQVQTVMREAESLAHRNKVSRFVDNETLISDAGEGAASAADASHAYFPRIRIDVPEGRGRGSVGSAKIGSKPFYDKSRVFETEAAGKAAGVNYLPSIERRVGEYVRKTYKKIADRRMADDPSLQGSPKREVLRFGEAEIEHPAFRGRVYPVQTADFVNNFYRSRDSSFRQAVVSANSVLKQIGFSLDWAAPFLQGQVMMFTHPARWAKAAWESGKAFLDKDTLARYAAAPENLSAIRELSQLGVKVSELQDFMLAEGAGKKIGNLPGFKQSKQSFETFLGVAQTELWKAYRDVTPKEQLPALAETLQNMLSHGRMEEAGLSPGRALMERTLLLAPSYLRGSIGLVSSIAQQGASGAVARRAIGSYVLGGSLLYYGLMKSAGKSDEEILERMDPSKSNFMTVPVEFADGRTRNIGFGGAIKSLVRLTASVSDAIINHPERLQPGADDNPVIRWLRGKAAPLPGFATDALLGTDFLGNEITWLDALRARVTPLPVQQIIKRPGEPDATAGDIIPGALGLAVYPENLRNQFAMDRNATAKKEFGKDFEKLSVADQLKVTKEVEAKPVFAVKEPTSKRMIERAFQADIDRRERIVKKLSLETQGVVKALGLTVPGYEAKISLGSKEAQLTLTKKQQERLEEIISEEYESVLQKAFSTDGFDRLEPSSRQEIANKLFVAAKEASRARLLGEIEANSKNF